MDLKKYPKLAGIFLLLTGGGLSVWFYDYVMQTAQEHSKATIVLPHAFAALVSLACLGIAMLLFGEKVQAYSKALAGRKKTLKDFLILGIFILPGLAADLFLQHQLSDLGYE